MDTPKTAQVTVELIPVACDVIAEYGDKLMMLNGVIIGVYTQNAGSAPDIAEAAHAAFRDTSSPAKRQSPVAPRIPDEVFLRVIDAMTENPSIPRIAQAIRIDQMDDALPSHIIRDRMATLEKRGKVTVFIKSDGGKSLKCYRVVHERPNDGDLLAKVAYSQIA